MAVCTINLQAQTDSLTIASDSIYKTVEVMPEFPGGQVALMEYLKKVSFPPITRENDLEGTVYIQFVIEKDGAVNNMKVARSSGQKILDDSAIEHVKAMPHWKPGSINGKPVRMQYVVPVKFKLQ